MLIDGFWFDEKMDSQMLELGELNANAGDVATSLKILYPNHRQIETKQDFMDFVSALNEYRRLEED